MTSKAKYSQNLNSNKEKLVECTGQKRESTLRGVFEIDINFSLIFIRSFSLVAVCAHPIKNCILKGPYNRCGHVIKMLYFPFSFHTFPPVGIQTWFKLKMLAQQDRRKQGATLSLFSCPLTLDCLLSGLFHEE